MPSIIEVDTIKNKTGTQNTVLSTDGSGNNTLNAGVIKSNTGSNTGLTIASDGQITVNQNNPTVTLGSNATGFTGAKEVDFWKLKHHSLQRLPQKGLEIISFQAEHTPDSFLLYLNRHS